VKTIFYVGALYFAVVGLAAFVSNSAKDSPTADTVAALPSAGTLLGANNVKTEGGINLAASLTLATLAYLNVV
jgi:hypothetical protein